MNSLPTDKSSVVDITLCVLIDGLRHDYLEQQQAPFLCELAERGFSAPLRETFAFQLRPAFFAGLWPEECGVAHLFMHHPDDSPYRFLEEAPWMSALSPQWEGMLRSMLQAEAKRVEVCSGHSASARYLSPAKVPFSLLPYFSHSEAELTWMPESLPFPTVFDYLRARGEEWLWIAYPGDNQRTQALLEAFRQRFRPGLRLVYLHFAELDWVGHSEGPHSQAQRRCLKEIDSVLHQIIRHLQEAGLAWNAVIFGDHGMVPVARTVDILSLLRFTGLRVPDDYIYFLDSTQARFWFSSDNARARIEKELCHFSGGRLLSEEDLARLHFRFPEGRFGELIWVADEGVIISPNFFQGKEPVRGMHGYLPEVKANWARLIAVGEGMQWPSSCPVEMIEVFPILLQLLGIKRPH